MADEMNGEREALMKLADAYAEASFDQGLHKRTLDDAPEGARAKLEKGLRDALAGRASLAANAGGEPVAVLAMRMLVAAGHITQAKADESLRLAAEYTHPSPPEGMAEWRPIDTAPKDGTLILVREPRCSGLAVMYLHGWKYESGGICYLEPTHWMPLPAPPLPASEAGEA